MAHSTTHKPTNTQRGQQTAAMARYVVFTKWRKRRLNAGIRTRTELEGWRTSKRRVRSSGFVGGLPYFRSSREELSSNTKRAVKNVGINNGRSALQTRHGEKRFPLHCLAGERLPFEQLLWLHSVSYEVGTSRHIVRDPMKTLPRETVFLQSVSTNGMRRVRLSRTSA